MLVPGFLDATKGSIDPFRYMKKKYIKIDTRFNRNR